MLPVSALDYVFLGATSIMLGAYIALQFYNKNAGGVKEDLAAVGGGAAGVLAFGCPICNTLLVSLLGAAAVLTYYEPLRPAVGVLGIALLIYGRQQPSGMLVFLWSGGRHERGYE